MVTHSLLSKCGIYCGACFIYRASKDGGHLLDNLSREMNVPREEVKCSGCLGPRDEIWQGCKKCFVSACLKEKGHQFCYECSEFENKCAKYEKLLTICSERGEDPKEALRRIKAGEADAWLKEQEERWRCPTCHRPISWYEVTCHHCGNPCVSPNKRRELENALQKLKLLQGSTR